MGDIDNIGQRIKELRLYLQESQESFARKIGVDNSTLSKYEKGIRKPAAEFFIKVFDHTCVNLNWLIVGEGEMFPLDNGVITGNRELAKQIDEHAEQIRQLLGKFRDPTTWGGDKPLRGG